MIRNHSWSVNEPGLPIVDLGDELYRTREALDSRGCYRHGQKSNVPNGTSDYSWSRCLDDVGLARTTVHRWLERFVLEEWAVVTPE